LLAAHWALLGAGIASAADTQKLELRHVRTLNNDFAVTALAWHPDGRHLAVGQVLNKRVAIWDTQTGKPVRTLESEPGGVSALAYSPDGKYLAVGREFTTNSTAGRVTNPHAGHPWPAALASTPGRSRGPCGRDAAVMDSIPSATPVSSAVGAVPLVPALQQIHLTSAVPAAEALQH
jgi:hypothetical protein